MLELNTANLYAILRDFYVLTNIRIVIFDRHFRELMAYPGEKEGFCAILRSDPNAEENASSATAPAVSNVPAPAFWCSTSAMRG